MLLIFYQTLNDPKTDLGAPRWLAGNGIIGDNPGRCFKFKRLKSYEKSYTYLESKVMNLIIIHKLYIFIGVGYRPKPPDANVESTLITFKHAEVESAGTWSGWVKRLNDFIERKNTNEFFNST